jgi:hypothetical protein
MLSICDGVSWNQQKSDTRLRRREMKPKPQQKYDIVYDVIAACLMVALIMGGLVISL